METTEDSAPPENWQDSIPDWIEILHAPVDADGVAPMVMAMVPPGRMAEWAKNPRNNTEAAERLAKSMGIHKFRVPAILDQNGGIVCGHTRKIAAMASEMDRVPVLVQWFASEKDKDAFAIVENRSASWSDWAYPELKDIIQEEFDTGEFDDLDARLGWTDKELEDLMTFMPEEKKEIDDPGPSEPPEDPVTRTGDLWILGRHVKCPKCRKKTYV